METESRPKALPNAPNEKMKKALTITSFAVVVAAAGAGLYAQQHKLHNTNAQNASLTSQVKQLTASNGVLKSKNTALSKSVAALSAQQTKSAKQSQPSATASLTIDKVQILTPSYFGNTGTEANTTQLRAVFVTMTNLTSSNQTYNLLDFTATTDEGEIVRPLVYASAGSGNFWNNSTLAANGKTSQAITFPASDKLVTLQWTPAGSDTITLPIPAATE